MVSIYIMRVWCSLVSHKLAKFMTRVQIPAPAFKIFNFVHIFPTEPLDGYAGEYAGEYADNYSQANKLLNGSCITFGRASGWDAERRYFRRIFQHKKTSCGTSTAEEQY